MRRLSEAQHALLPRLALFEGGASEDDLLAITEIPESEWVKLRQALEQAALLTAEQVKGFTAPFLHFHPVLAPYLRSQEGAGDPALRERYAQRYYSLANYLYREDDRHPQEVRALVQKELPNLRRALELLLEVGDLDAASDMADSIAKFLNNFGLFRERDELRRRVVEAVAAKGAHASGGLTYAEFLRESGLGEDEYKRGKIGAAYTRFTKLRSYEHCVTLTWLARCLNAGGQPAAAEESLRKALTVIEALIGQQPENEGRIRMRGVLLTDLADVLMNQGKYSQAQESYDEALKIALQQGDLQYQRVVQGDLGLLAIKQRNYTKAREYYTRVLTIARNLSEPQGEAIAWHQLGRVAQEQDAWAEAERCYRDWAGRSWRC